MVHHFVCWYVKCVEKVPFRKSGHKLFFILERIQGEYILNDYYKTRLIQLDLLPLMYQYELNDLLTQFLWHHFLNNSSNNTCTFHFVVPAPLYKQHTHTLRTSVTP